MHHLSTPRRTRSGFTLLELLIGVVASTFIVAAMTEGMGLISQQMEHIRTESDSGPDETVALITDMARYGWVVEKPSDTRLDIVDAAAGRTIFELVNGALKVTRPSGATGTLMDGVASFSVETDTSRRLREAMPVDDFRTWFDRPAVGSLDDTLTLETGLPLALGFTMPSAVPDSYDVVAGVDENAVIGTLLTLDMALSYVSAIPEDPNEPVAGDGSDPGGKGKGKGGKVDICHIPPGNPANAHTLNISVNAVDAHLAHGDVLGSCSALPPPTQAAELVISLYEARAPDDARPHGPVLGAMVLVANAIPNGSASWVQADPGTGSHSGECSHSAEECGATTPNGKVMMCHVPPGNPGNAHTITISQNAVAAHLAHGDYYGGCGEHDDPSAVYSLEIDATPSQVSLDLSPLGAIIEPGRAYSLVISMQSEGFIVVGGDSVAAAENSGVAQSSSLNGSLQPVAMAVPFALQGMQRITQTAEHEPISRVSLTVAMDSGKTASGSASVTSQVAIPGLWEGVVSGEIEALEQ